MSLYISGYAQSRQATQRPQETGLTHTIGADKLPNLPREYRERDVLQQRAITPLDCNAAGA